MAKAQPVLGVDPDNSIRANAALIVPVRAAELIAWERYIDDPARIAELHQMRIAAKRLRYTMELFAPFYGPGFAAAIDRVKNVQEQLGRIHDADVLVPELLGQLMQRLRLPRKKKKRRDPGVYCADFDAAAGLLELCRRKQAERETLYRKFLANWRKMRSGGFFESLRTMVRESAAEEVLQPTRNGPSVARRPATDAPTPNHVLSEAEEPALSLPKGTEHPMSEDEPVEAIPGIGLIRARALRKAGWESVTALKTATLSDLRAIPGISEQKARQILNYVNGGKKG